MQNKAKGFLPWLPLAAAMTFTTHPARAADAAMAGTESVLMEKLAERDATIAAMQRRLDRLERRVNRLTAAAAAAVQATPQANEVAAGEAARRADGKAGTAVAAHSSGATTDASTSAESSTRGATFSGSTSSGPASSRSATLASSSSASSSLGSSSPGSSSPGSSSPGSSPPGTAAASRPRSQTAFTVDEDAAQRALERTLTQARVLLLPSGVFELTPSFIYTRREIPSQSLVNVTPANGAPFNTLVNVDSRWNEYVGNFGLRYGLPFDSQVELGVPFTHIDSSQVSALGTASATSANGIGDLTIGIAKTLAREKGWVPDLIGRVSYNFGNGKRQVGVINLNAGYRQAHAELVALKRQDPLAFFASAFYTRVFEKDQLKPGDVSGFSLGTVLAASPATSLQFAFTQVFQQKQQAAGDNVPGSNSAYGVMSVGATSVLSRRVSLNAQVGVGMGNNAPRYTFILAMPILFY